MFSPHVEYILLGRSLKPPDWPPHHFFLLCIYLLTRHVRAIEDATFLNHWCQIGAYHGSVKRQHCFFFGCIHLLQVANFYVSYPFQSLVVKKWRPSQLYLEKFKISTLINKCPGFPGNSRQKELAKKKGSDPKNTNLQFTPPIATNMEVNLRIVTLVNVEEKKMHIICIYLLTPVMSERLRMQPFEINGAKLVLITEVSKHNTVSFLVAYTYFK